MVRFKTRFILTEISIEDKYERDFLKLNASDIYREIRDAMSQNFGDIGLAQVLLSLQLSLYNRNLKVAVVRCSRDYAQNVITSLSFITSIQNIPITLRAVRLNGSNRTCQNAVRKFYLEKAKKLGIELHQQETENDLKVFDK